MKRTTLVGSGICLFAGIGLLGCSQSDAGGENTTSSTEPVLAESEVASAAQAGEENTMATDQTTAASTNSVLAGLTMDRINGESESLETYSGQVVLVVNTASKCGYTRQYDGLQELYEKYQDRGFVVLGFPANDFGGQEPGSEEEIAEFCRMNYGVTFPMFAKTSVKGDAANPLHARLNAMPEPIGGDPRWNFTKFLIGPDGQVVERFESAVEPMSDELTGKVESLLDA